MNQRAYAYIGESEIWFAVNENNHIRVSYCVDQHAKTW
jgi:hypothetical protein